MTYAAAVFIRWKVDKLAQIRLDKFVSNQTTLTRSEARKAVFCGRVTVDGEVIRQPDSKIDEQKAKVTLDSEEITFEKYVYLIMNKPKGVLSATNDKRDKTVVDLLPEIYSKRNIFPAGRLDKDSTGMVLLTDDGDFAHRITGPKHHIEKSYIVELDGEITDDVITGFKEGVTLYDGEECLSAVCEKLSNTTARVILTEGKYHQIKRMFGVFDLGVMSLHRERIGNLFLPKNLKSGEFCKIDPKILTN